MVTCKFNFALLFLLSGEENGNPLQYPCQESLMNRNKRLTDMTLEDESPRPEGVHYCTGEERREISNSSRATEMAGPKPQGLSAVDGRSESKV